MSTRIFGFKTKVDVQEHIEIILIETVRASLRWPSFMVNCCEPLHPVHHPKENSSAASNTKMSDWKERILLALI